MRILICDYANVMESDYSLTIQKIKEQIPDAVFQIEAYTNDTDLYRMADAADGMITAFLPLNQQFFEHVHHLKCVSINAVGYGNVDLAAASRNNVAVCHIKEYCTQEVAEHTFALIEALNRNLKYYNNRIEQDYEWKYHTISGGRPLSGQTIAIFGLGRIGKRVAELAKAFGMKVIAVDPYISPELAKRFGVKMVSAKEAFAEADVISNHMNLTDQNYHLFGVDAFEAMKRKPIFINVGRGACMDENALAIALDQNLVRAAGLDVLEDEEPALQGHPLLNRDNVLITPHSAFYSESSMEKLQTISADNLANYLMGNMGRIKELLNMNY